jgi:uncharacterized protein (TIGR02145 family)
MKNNHRLLKYIQVIIGLLIILTNSCKKEDDNNTPPTSKLAVLTTSNVINISYNSARCGGKITSDGGAKVTARGVCFSLFTEPTIADNKTVNGTDTGSYTSVLTGLKAKTKYYVRAYATNSVGTAYGSVLSFNTSDYYITGNGVTDIDGNKYTSIILGSQEWTVENLKVTRYQNGDTIPYISDNTEWFSIINGACCDYENDSANTITYGKLYNFFAVNDPRFICPTGWHVPIDAEWSILSNYLGGQNVAGGKLKESGTSHWMSPNMWATNVSGFTALPGGIRSSINGIFNYLGEEGDWWTSTEDDESNAWEWYLLFNDSTATNHYYDKNLGLSVRCIKNK